MIAGTLRRRRRSRGGDRRGPRGRFNGMAIASKDAELVLILAAAYLYVRDGHGTG